MNHKNESNKSVRPAILYRHFDSEGRLLYVGQSVDVPRRTAEHLRGAQWRKAISVVSVERFESVAEVIAAEKAAIKREKPLWNSIHQDSSGLEKMKRLTLDLEEDLHRAIKKRSINECRSMAESLRELLRSTYLAEDKS